MTDLLGNHRSHDDPGHDHPSHDRAGGDDPTIDGADLLAEVRAALGFGRGPEVPPLAGGDDPADVEDPADLTIDGFDFLARFDLGEVFPPAPPPSRPPAVGPPPATRWSPPTTRSAPEPLRPIRPCRLQLAVVALALLTGVALAWLVLEATVTR